MRIDKDINKDNWGEIKDILPDITEIKSLNLSWLGLTEFPKMSHITINSYFGCSNNKITSFKGCPQIGGDFYCSNNKITSFNGCPQIKGDFYCSYNKIKSFKDCPEIGGDFKCNNNKITSFKGCPIINGIFNCNNNQLSSFKDCPQIKGDFYCWNNLITSFKDCPEIGGYFNSDFDIFDVVQEYSKEKKISLIKAQVELYNKQDAELLEHIDKFPDLVAYIRLKELNKLL